MSKILCVGAHPDDIEFGMGALILNETQKGNEVKYVICSLGEAGSNGTPEGRKQEAINAGSILGVKDIEFLNMGGDSHIENNSANAIAMAKIIRQYKPDIVLTTEMQVNQHPDHYNVSRITHSACRLARYGGLTELKDFPTHKVSGLYFYASRAEWGQKPDIVIDVSEHYETWVKAMQAHESQMKTKSYVELVTSKSSALGASIGVKHAIGLWSNDPIRINNISDLSLSSRNY